MATLPWTVLLDVGDPEAAHLAWQQEFSTGNDSEQATWELAEIEERWGDSLFFAGEPGAAVHYRAAWRALAPLGVMFSSWEEGERRMVSYGRVGAKLQAVDPYGMPREGNKAQPHPNFHAIERPRKLAPEPARVSTEPAPEPAEPALSPAEPAPACVEPEVATLETEPAQLAPELAEPAPEPLQPAPEPAMFTPEPAASPPLGTQGSDLARVLQSDDHWRNYDLASQWREAGQELAPAFPAGARSAFEWSVDYFTLYNRAWNAHAPASRWDSDGGQEIDEVQSMMNALAGNPGGAALPTWVEALLAGDWRRASAALGDAPAPPEFKAAGGLLSQARGAAGEEAPGTRT